MEYSRGLFAVAVYLGIITTFLAQITVASAQYAPKVWVENSEHLSAATFLATFPTGMTADIRTIMYDVTTESNHISCNSVFFLGPSSDGKNELVGFKLVHSATHPEFYEVAEPLKDGIELIGVPAPLAVVVCDRISNLSALSGFLTRSSSEEYPQVSSSIVTPTPHTLDQCHRSSLGLKTQQQFSSGDVTLATAAAVSAVNTAFARNSLLNDATTFFSFSNTESEPSIFRTCGRRRETSADMIIEDLVVSTLLANSPIAVVAAVVVPVIQQHLGPVVLTSDIDYIQSGSREDVDFKCASRTLSPNELPRRDRCVYERCSSPPVLASEPQCYFGSSIVSDAECAFDPVVPPVQRDCDIVLHDLALDSSINTEGDNFFIIMRMYFDDLTDIHQDDFPQITIELDNYPGFIGSKCKYSETLGDDETGARRRDAMPCDLIFSDNGIVFNFNGNASHFITIVLTDVPQQVEKSFIRLSDVRVSLRRSNTLIYSSQDTPRLDGVLEVDPQTERQEFIFDAGYPGSWQEIVAWVLSETFFYGTNLESIECSHAFKTSIKTLAGQNSSSVSVFPIEWTASEGTSESLRHKSVHDIVDMAEDPALSYTVRCTIDKDATITKIRHMFVTAESYPYSIRSVDLNGRLPVPRRHIGQLQFTVGGSNKSPAEITADLAKALSYEGSTPTVAKLLSNGSTPSSAIYTALFRVPPITSILLPSAEVLQAAFSNITGGAQLVLPGGATSAADVSRTILYSAVEEGVWQCGRDGSYGTCELPAPNCGDSYATPLRCVQSESGTALDPETDPSAAIACGFDEQVLPTLPQSAGCGSFSCLAPDGTVVPCNDARICISGCAVNVTISNDVVAGNSEFRPVCVKDGIVQDDIYCPSTLVSSPSYAPTCSVTSSCGTVCFAESTGKRVECTDTASWSECLDTCNGGFSTHFARCADTTVPVGDAAATEVPVSLCPGGVLNVELSTACPVDLSTCPGPNVTVEATSVEGEYTITWDDANGKVDVAAQDNALVQLVPVPVEGSAAIVLGTVNATDFEFSFDTVTQSIVPGQYVAVVTLDGVLKGESEPFTVFAVCNPACVNGTCNGFPGQCDCDAGFTGEDCSITHCDVKQCNADTTEECSADAGVAVCKCKGEWSGERCEVSPCSDVKQCNADTTEECSADTGVAVCKCKGAWSGEHCDVSPCYTCSQEGGSCVVTDENTANCKCFTDNEGTPAFYGDNCDIPSNYCETHAPPCDHNGTRAGEFLNGAFVCTDCACTQNWDSATDCKTCGLPCAHGSAPDNNECVSCKCPIMGGYSGPLCECRNAYMTFIARDKDVDFDAVASAFERVHGGAADTSPVEQLSSLFATELASVTKITVVAGAVKSMMSDAGVHYHEVALSVGPQCSGLVPVNDEHMIPTYEVIESLKQFLSADSHTANHFVALSAAHVPSGFSVNDPNCKLLGNQCPTGWNGNGKHIDADETQDCDGANASRPECGGGASKSGSDGLSTGAIVGIAVGGSVALILVLLLIFWVAGIGCFAARRNTSPEMEMTSV